MPICSEGFEGCVSLEAQWGKCHDLLVMSALDTRGGARSMCFGQHYRRLETCFMEEEIKTQAAFKAHGKSVGKLRLLSIAF